MLPKVAVLYNVVRSPPRARKVAQNPVKRLHHMVAKNVPEHSGKRTPRKHHAHSPIPAVDYPVVAIAGGAAGTGRTETVQCTAHCVAIVQKAVIL